MTTVSQKSFVDPMTSVEDGMSVPADPKCTNAAQPKAAESAAPKADADTFETVDTAQTRARLAETNAKRAALAPKLEEAETDAARQLPKAIPFVGTLSQVGFAVWDLAHGHGKKQSIEAGKSMAETKVANEVGRMAVDKYGKVAGEAVEAVAVFKDAYDIHSALREYGKLVKEDEALKYEAQDLMMKLDPKRKFELVKVEGKTFFRQDGKLISDKPEPKATNREQDLCEKLFHLHNPGVPYDP